MELSLNASSQKLGDILQAPGPQRSDSITSLLKLYTLLKHAHYEYMPTNKTPSTIFYSIDLVWRYGHIYIFFFLSLCFTSYFVFSMAVLPHRPGVVYYHLLFRRETRIPGVAPFSFRIGIWDLFVHRGQKSYTPTAFGKLWTSPGVRCMKHASS